MNHGDDEDDSLAIGDSSAIISSSKLRHAPINFRFQILPTDMLKTG